jgi:hypothetical protein
MNVSSADLSCGLFGRIAHASSPGPLTTIGSRLDALVDLRPEIRDVVVNDDDADQPGVHHFEIVVFELFRRRTQPDGRLTFLLESFVERRQVFPVAGRLADEDFLPARSLIEPSCGDCGPVTTISFIPVVVVGIVKSTILSRSGVIVRLAIAMSRGQPTDPG